MRLSLEALLCMSPEQALLRVRNASRVPGAVCRGLADHVFSLRFKNPGLMEMWGRVADAAASKTDDQVAAGLACAHFGNSLRVNGDCGAASGLLDKAEELLPNPHPVIHEFRASLLLACRNFSGALSELRKAEEMRSASGDQIGLAKVLMQAGMVYDFQQQPRDAARMLEQVVKILVECGVEGRELLLVALQNLADCLISDGQLGKTRALLDAIEEPLAATGEVNALKLIWLHGRLESYAGADDEARKLLEAARIGFRKQNMRREVALISLHLASLHYQYGRHATSAREALKVEPELEVLGLDQDTEVTDLLGQIATGSVDMERALVALTSAISRSRQKKETVG
jgi:tetratricopeptide (TPR) repeat protein